MLLQKSTIRGATALWGMYGGVRGWNYYNTEYELQTNYYKKKNEENPTIYSMNEAPSYYYITRSCYACAGVIYYILPLTFVFAGVNEFYRTEIMLRNMVEIKKTVPYYNPFYPFYYSRKY